MLFGKQDKESDPNQILLSIMDEVKMNFKKVDTMLLESIKPLQDRVAKLEDGSKHMSDLLKEAFTKLNSIDPQSVVALRLRLTSLELDFQNQAETINDMKVVKDELEQTMNLKIATTEKRNEENIANVVDTVGSTCKNLIEESEANLLKVVKDEFIGELEQNIKHKIETTEKSIEENLLSKIDDVQTNLEVAQHGYLNDIKQVQEDNDELKSCSDFADTKIKKLKDSFEEFKTDWIVFKKEIVSCGKKVEFLEKTQKVLKEDNIKRIDKRVALLETSKSIPPSTASQDILKVQREIESLKDLIAVRHCNYCNKKFKTIEGLRHHVQAIHANNA